MSSRPTRPPGTSLALHDGDRAAAPGQMQCGRQSGQAGADHHHVIGSAPPTIRIMRPARVQTAAMLASAARTDSSIRPVVDPVSSAVAAARRSSPRSAAPRRSRRSMCATAPTSSSSRSVALISSASWRRMRRVGHADGRRPPRWSPCVRSGRRRTGLPVTVGEPKMPSRSSRSWNASPTASP